jgi:lactate dehydrogenase-like 2-hydroxyacid dehydrogenase
MMLKKLNQQRLLNLHIARERNLILELGRIGNNVNQIAKAINTDIAGTGTFDKVKLLHLLISIDQQLRELRPDDR